MSCTSYFADVLEHQINGVCRTWDPNNMWSLILWQPANCLKRSFIVNSSIIYVTSIVKSPLEDQHVRLNLLPFHSILFEDMISTTPQSNMSFYKPIPRPFWLFGWAAKSQSYGCIAKLSGEIIV